MGFRDVNRYNCSPCQKLRLWSAFYGVIWPRMYSFEDEPKAFSRMADLLGRDSYSTLALHDGHVPIAPELYFFNPSVVQLEVEAGEDGRDCEI